MFGDRAMPMGDHVPDPNARKIAAQSDKTFGNCYICAISSDMPKAPFKIPPESTVYTTGFKSELGIDQANPR